MELTRMMERAMFLCPEMDLEDYEAFPPVSEEQFSAMRAVYEQDPSLIRLFPFIREDKAGGHYVEFYIWDMMLYPDLYARFLIRDGCRMQEEAEEMYLDYADRLLFFDGETMERFLGELPRRFPQWHLGEYTPGRVGKLIAHLYFASHHSGAREILYKADLPNIALHLDRLPDYNMIGTTPEKIVGHELPLRLLRILNRPEFLDQLFDEGSMDHCAAVYRRYSGYIGGEDVSRGQWRYLEELDLSDGQFGGEGFCRALYARLREEGSEYSLEAYREFLHLRAEFADFRKLKLPSPWMVRTLVEKLKMVRQYRTGKSGIDQWFLWRSRRSAYGYRGRDFLVRMPKSAFEVCLESIAQSNCIMEYIEAHAGGETTILFLRRTNAPDRSFVSMEVKDNRIVQVYGRFNQLPDREVYAFLEEYARKEWLLYDPSELIAENRAQMDEEAGDEHLQEYLLDYRRRTGNLPGEEESGPGCEQLSLEKVFPALFGNAAPSGGSEQRDLPRRDE